MQQLIATQTISGTPRLIIITSSILHTHPPLMFLYKIPVTADLKQIVRLTSDYTFALKRFETVIAL